MSFAQEQTGLLLSSSVFNDYMVAFPFLTFVFSVAFSDK